MASLDLKVRTNAREVQRALGHLAKRQLPFAVAAGLTDTARQARDKFKEDLPNRFTVRSRRVLTTATFVRAEKRDFPKSKAIVGVRDEFVARHEKGGRQRTESGNRFAIPFRIVKRTATGRIPARFKPRRLRSKSNVFVDEAEQEIQRKASKRTRGRRRLHLLRKHINLRPVLGFRATVSTVARRRLSRNIETRLRKSIRDTSARFS